LFSFAPLTENAPHIPEHIFSITDILGRFAHKTLEKLTDKVISEKKPNNQKTAQCFSSVL